MNLKHIRDTFSSTVSENSITRCLMALIKFYGGEFTPQQVQSLYKKNLGNPKNVFDLVGALEEVNFEVDIFQFELEELKNVSEPVLMPVAYGRGQTTFQILYGYHEKFLIGHPELGIVELSYEELEAIWISKTIIKVTPNNYFITAAQRQNSLRSSYINFFKKAPFGYIFLSLSVLVISAIFFLVVLTNMLAFPILIPFAFFVGAFSFYFSKLLISKYTGITFYKSIELILDNLFMQSALHANEIYSVTYVKKVQQIFDLRLRILDEFQYFQLSIIFIILLPAYALFLGLYDVFFLYLVIIFSSLYIIYKQFSLLQEEHFKHYISEQSTGIQIFQEIENLYSTIPYLSKGKANLSLISNFNSQSLLSKFYSKYALRVLLCISFILVAYYGFAYFIGIRYFDNVFLVFVLTASLLCIHRFSGTAGILRILFEHFIIEYDSNEAMISKAVRIRSINVCDLSFTYSRPTVLFDAINCKFSVGDVSAIVGASGSGKTTFVKLLAGHLKPDGGMILYNNGDSSIIGAHSLAKLDENCTLIPGTIFENIGAGIFDYSAHDIIKFCKDFEFHDVLSSLPNGYMTKIDVRASNVSKSIRRLILLARTLYAKPDVLIIDGFFDGMDDKIKGIIERGVTKLKDDMLIILVLNARNESAVANRFYDLKLM